MYCIKCGTQNPEGVGFCIKCGSSMDLNSGEDIRPQKKGSPVIAVVAILAVIIIVGVIKVLTGVIAGGQKTDEKSFSLDAISKQCDGCEEALNVYLEMLEESKSLNSTPEIVEAYEEELSRCMRHDCSAKVIQVENIPYAYRGSVGVYSGGWQGAGPSGYGTYKGAVYWSDVVSYTGDWKYGLPDGEGELYVQEYAGGWDMEYKGQLAEGKRNGEGYLIEYYRSIGDGMPSKYRIYDKTVFQYDELARETECVQYLADTGELHSYYRMIGDGNGWVDIKQQWYANELSPEQQQLLDYAECAFVIGTIGYMVNTAIHASEEVPRKSYEEQMAELNHWREQKEAEERQAQEWREKEAEENRNFCRYKYEQLHAIDPTDSSLDAQYYEKNMY